MLAFDNLENVLHALPNALLPLSTESSLEYFDITSQSWQGDPGQGCGREP